jgi:hypothetical protein
LIFPALQTLKLRQTALSDSSLNGFLFLCHDIRRLDISFTRFRHFSESVLNSFANLEKLSLTSTHISKGHCCDILIHTPNLAILNIGALGGGRGQAVDMGNATSLTMTDDFLVDMTDILSSLPSLNSVSLVGNSKIGQRRQPLIDFIAAVGRRLKVRVSL